ncbi:MAG: hypothetical protein NTW28_23095 [Candidatus Solibacter sp.]|nr:hypothetical protein [Candidatus Solibacter sp.]
MQESLVSELQEIEKREALQRVLASGTFHRADQLKTLLRYVCERAISGRGEGLDEYTVAVEALGRPRNYTPLEDGTVRNRIHHLRHRLEHYYALENRLDPVHIVLPKGSYCPSFQRQMIEAPAAPRLEALRPAPQAVWNRPVPLWSVCAISAIALVLAAAGWWAGGKARPGPDAVLAEAWGPLLAKNANPLICIATSAQLALIQRPPEPPGKPTVTSPDLLEWYQSLPGLPPSKQIYLGPSLTAPFWGDVAGVLAVSRVLEGVGITPEVLPESSIQLRGMNKRNVLMFGRPGFSKTTDLYLAEKPFRVRIPDERHGNVIWNVDPKPGELPEYDNREASRAANRDVAFGLITVMPSLGDPNLRTIVLSGTLSPGTQAASEFFSSPKQLQAFLRLLRKEGHAGFPPSYQVIVRSNIFDTSALDVQYVTHRVISKSRN